MKFRKYAAEKKNIIIFLINIIFAVVIFGERFLQPDSFVITYSAVFLNVFAHSLILFFGRISKKNKNTASEKFIDSMTPALMGDFTFPIIVTDSRGYIIWYNEAAAGFLHEHEADGNIFKKSISAVSNNQLSIESFYYNESGDTFIKTYINERVFNVTLNSFNNLNMFVFEEMTEFEQTKKEMDMRDPAAAYFMIDNLDEAAHKLKEKNRIASGAVSDLLHKFVHDCGGVLKEYDKDKYLCFFENRALNNFIKNKFNILDLVREIKIEELNMPVTISGGVSNISGSLAEKEAAARHALDIALQRGGDQVVVKSSASIEYYGGKTKSVQKKTKVKSRVVANDLAEHMKRSSNVLIMGHKFADNDSIGACVGIARFAASKKCRANIVVNIHDANIKSAFHKLRGLAEYNDIFIDEAAALDKIKSNTFIIALDVNNPVYFESEAIFKNAYKTAVIDHHRKTIEYIKEPDIVYIEPSASSTSELVAEILEQSLAPGELLKEEAELLMAGIFLDTNSFSKNTGTRTFSAALYLRGEGANPSEALSLFNKTDVAEFTKEAQFESNIIIYRNIIAISIYEKEAAISDKTAGARAANRMLGIDGVEASFVIFRIGDAVHISARSLGKINVQLIMEALGGGGHFDGAGAQVKSMGLKDVLVLLKKVIDEYLGEE